jgi:polysaccharide biosynthesis/export protein
MLAMVNRSRSGVSMLFVALSFTVSAQQPQPGTGAGQTTPQPGGAVNATQAQPAAELPADISPTYTLGANDQILIRAPGVDEINERPFRIDSEGFLNLPVAGRIRAAGLTVHGLETEITNRLHEFFVNPQVFISVTQFQQPPVFFQGMFLRPGIMTLRGRRTLLEMLALVGGLQPNASRRIKIRRHLEYGPIPLPTAIEDADRKTSTVEISFASLRENVNPAEDIVLQPYDVVTVDRAEPVYVAGEVARPGVLDLGERDYLTVTQALTMAGGFTRDAKRSDVRVLRPILDTNRRAEIPINLTGIYEGRVNDFPLLPNDLLYVPHSSTRTILTGLVPIGLSVLNPFIYLAIQGK